MVRRQGHNVPLQENLDLFLTPGLVYTVMCKLLFVPVFPYTVFPLEAAGAVRSVVQNPAQHRVLMCVCVPVLAGAPVCCQRISPSTSIFARVYVPV